jgi:hypothetical protein
MVRTSIYNPEGTEAECMMNMALMHGKEYKQREEIGDYAWVKSLKLADRKCVPASEEDMKKMEAGRTWRHWEYVCSGDPDKVWTALCSLKAAGDGEIRDGKWMMFNREHYTLYLPDRRGLSGDEAWNGGNGHLDLLVGEMVLTLDKPIALTYWSKGQWIQEQGVMAMAVRTQPHFSIRSCSTYHQLGPKNVEPLEYKLLHKSITELHTQGLIYLSNSMGHTVIPGRGEGVPRPFEPQRVTLPMETYLHATLHQEIETPLIDLDLPGPIPLPTGTGPLPNLQVDPRIQARQEKRMETIGEWIAEEKENYLKFKYKEEELKETDNLDVLRAQLERSARKLELYTEMLSETSRQVGRLWGENPAIEWITEMRGREWSSFGPSSDKKVHDAYEKAMETLKQSVDELLDGTWSTVTAT